MRKVIDLQMKLGEIDIASIELDLFSRDEIPQLLMGLQEIYRNRETRAAVFQALEETIGTDRDLGNGRPGMELWKILVLGTLRLACNWDYDKLREIANNHFTIRQMIGHSVFDWDQRYALQTLIDNISLFTPELYDRINQIVIHHTHSTIGPKAQKELNASADSFVVETNVHFPTDLNLLLDAQRKAIAVCRKLCEDLGKSDWRQGAYQTRKLKRAVRKASKLKASNCKQPEKQERRQRQILQAYQQVLDIAHEQVGWLRVTLDSIDSSNCHVLWQIEEIERYLFHSVRQIDQIRRRVMEGEVIPHPQKVFSIFEPHTEWISKGKAGVPVELGLRVCVVKDQFGLILHHLVMEHKTDDQVAVPIVRDTKQRFSNLRSCSFDKGFHSPENQRLLKELLDRVILPRKGKLSATAAAVESDPDFVMARRKHSAVESAINALENHGLDRCPDRGLPAFKRYVALAVLARNLQLLGRILQKKRHAALKRAQRKCQRLPLVA